VSPLDVVRRYYGRIAEIRSYYQQPAATAELGGFPYAARGYSTDGAERSAIHDTGA
jgi:hypothetical protein